MSHPVRWAGTRSLLVELPTLEAVVALHGALADHPLPGQVEVLAAAKTVLVRFASRAAALSGRAAIDRLEAAPARARAGRTVEIDVVYTGEDLAEVGRLTGLGPEGVVAAHTGRLWTAAFGGFAPGFSYLAGGDPALEVPRRDTPRTAVPAGSVALAGRFSAVYPRRSPGGWQLIGHTGQPMWDLSRESPALVMPGDRVRFIAVREEISIPGEAPGRDGADRPAEQASAEQDPAAGTLEVLDAGLQSLVQDLGRPGLGDLGVSASGAADAASARQANRLVGNAPGAAVIENLLGSLRLKAHGDQVLAVAGARVELEIVPAVAGPPRHPGQDAPFALLDGETLRLGPATTGLRPYIGVRGGLAVAPVLGSRSTDAMSGLGPAPLAPGMHLPVGPARPGQAVGSAEPSALRVAPGAVAVLRVVPGPRDDWFGPEGLSRLTGQEWLAGTESNRIGLRLGLGEGARPLERVRGGELPSEGAVAGSLQVPPSGLPVVFLADHPVTGGYPVIAAVVPEDLPVAAQLPPGTAIRFHLVDPDTLEPVTTPATTP
ncbi:allophanate hydrolase [Zafaria cholistanensis]|uniref:Allophanate hydrolase n=1 Tax=Zafaria cholistanensis TaxID=1682741 RepID=A0A5A7NPX3_9MICC|nr:carboxyltransferase domain-containing protein [Zafaria cholistanensis]GER22606.1 allophanate hydrolase [Zafaria cholistanensis]